MHPSYFMILDSPKKQSQIELTLSAEASEWLFYVKFWDEINKKYQTDFAQYEEENLSSNIIEETSNSLASLKESLLSYDGKVLNFRYAWNQSKEELICRVDSKIIADEIESLIVLLMKAAHNNLDVYCQL